LAGSLTDARRLAQNLGLHWVELPIEGPHAAFVGALASALSPPLTEEASSKTPDGAAAPAEQTMQENLQARVRGTLLMALSNRFGHLVLSTGNKSELAVGYCTLYGDMCGGLSVIGDVPKTMVYRLGEELNRQAGAELIPRAIFTKAPSAELRPNQTDQDTLPPYDLLDRILEAHIEQQLDAEALVEAGFPAEVVKDVLWRVRINEYKRRQAAPGLRITTKAFGSGRRMPIARGGS
jgi:NAD+ synthetase